MSFHHLSRVSKVFFGAMILLCSLLATMPVLAQGSDSLELLYSEAYDGGPPAQGVATFKHSRTWSIGDNFFFVDLANLGNFENAGNTYFEWGPRLSPGKAFGDGAFSRGLIRDFYLIAELDYVKNKFVEKAAYLAGISVDLALPGFRFFKLHLMNRNDPTLPGHTQQVSLSWNYPFSIAGRDFSFEGFFDAADGEGPAASTYHTQPQLLWALHDRLSLGLEYKYWHNKNGVPGFHESAMQGMLRINF